MSAKKTKKDTSGKNEINHLFNRFPKKMKTLLAGFKKQLPVYTKRKRNIIINKTKEVR